MRRARKVGSLLSSTCHTDDIMRNSGIRLTVKVKNVIHDMKESSQAAERCRRRSDLFFNPTESCCCSRSASWIETRLGVSARRLSITFRCPSLITQSHQSLVFKKNTRCKAEVCNYGDLFLVSHF